MHSSLYIFDRPLFIEMIISHALYLIEIRPPGTLPPSQPIASREFRLTGGPLLSLSDLISGGLDVPDRGREL